MAEKIIKVYMTTDSRGSFDYIPDYKEYEKQRQENEKERKKYYNEIQYKVSNGEFDGATAYELALENGFEGTEEEWLRSLKGDKGDTGEKGDKGDTGDTGPQGPKPVKGEDYLTTDEVDTIVQEISKSVDNARVDARVDLIVPKNKATGTQQAYIEDALEYKVYDLKVEGNYKQDGTPTPDVPVEVEVIEGDVSFKAIGQQLFNYKDAFSVPNEINVDEDGWITVAYDNTSGSATKFLNFFTNDLNLKLSTNYLIVYEIKEITGTGGLNVTSMQHSNGVQIGGQFNVQHGKPFSELTSNTINSFIAKTVSNELSVHNGLRTFAYFKAGESGSITFRLSVIEDTSITTDTFVYEPYKELSTPIDLQGNFVGKLPNGVADRLLYKDRHIYLEKNVGKIVLGGSEIWRDRPNYNYADRFVAEAMFPNDYRNISSNYFIFTRTLSDTYPSAVNNGMQLVINFSAKGTTTLAQFREWISEHKPKVYYQLTTPELIDLGEYDLSTLEGINHVVLSANLGPSNIEIEYALDLKKYTDKKINELTNALISTSANI